MNLKLALISAAAALWLGTAAQAAQVTLAPSSVIGGSGYYVACCDFQPGYIFDQQSGPVTENFGSGYWLNPDNGPANAFITFDLGAKFNLTSITLYNTHNGPYQDRGTGNFSIFGSNSLTNLGGNNYALAGASVVATGTLNPEFNTAMTITPQSFAAAGSFRYLAFNPSSVSSGNMAQNGNSCCGANVYGLNELKVFGAAVPEPSAWALMIGGFGLAGATLRRRRSVAAAA